MFPRNWCGIQLHPNEKSSETIHDLITRLTRSHDFVVKTKFHSLFLFASRPQNSSSHCAFASFRYSKVLRKKTHITPLSGWFVPKCDHHGRSSSFMTLDSSPDFLAWSLIDRAAAMKSNNQSPFGGEPVKWDSVTGGANRKKKKQPPGPNQSFAERLKLRRLRLNKARPTVTSLSDSLSEASSQPSAMRTQSNASTGIYRNSSINSYQSGRSGRSTATTMTAFTSLAGSNSGASSKSGECVQNDCPITLGLCPVLCGKLLIMFHNKPFPSIR